MAKTAAQHIGDLLNLHCKDIDLSLGRIMQLLRLLGNPHLNIPPVIHIAGTNGKGSASAFLRSMLEAAGYSVHVYTSPHLVHWHERYRIGFKGGGRFVNDAQLAEVLKHVTVTAANNEQSITVFEVLTVAALLLFAEYPADATILEVGLGGRLDATNVITKPAASLIMPISLDHQSFLGNQIEDIAKEKAGIIKAASPVVIGFQESESVRNILIHKAWKMGVPSSVYGQDYIAYKKHGRMIFQNCNGHMDLPLPRLAGGFQISNAAAAIEGLRAAGFKIRKSAIVHGMDNVFWPARIQHIRKGKLFKRLFPHVELWLDGGHNPAAGAVTAQFFRKLCEKEKRALILICGMIKTKDAVEYLTAFKNITTRLCAVPVRLSDDGILPTTLAQLARSIGLNSQAFQSLFDALENILDTKKLSSPSLVLICGSLYLAGEVLLENDSLPQ
ncbi:MAG: dihydrofolate synthase / folylpolyglutamate synthase [Candidatus Tokpelaia sp. JSC085]|nr:MAG: dihydrofolate synthase / folylpolyglutamate synthase [Candidatus Tokpelaia sp. JSC085]